MSDSLVQLVDFCIDFKLIVDFWTHRKSDRLVCDRGWGLQLKYFREKIAG
ncbi:hypothetical protein [Microcoleus sp. B4-D4]